MNPLSSPHLLIRQITANRLWETRAELLMQGELYLSDRIERTDADGKKLDMARRIGGVGRVGRSQGGGEHDLVEVHSQTRALLSNLLRTIRLRSTCWCEDDGGKRPARQEGGHRCPTRTTPAQPTGCLVAFKLNKSTEPPERAMLSSREGNRVYVRAVDPCDPQPPGIRASPGDQGRVLKNELAELYVRKVAPANDPLDDGVPLFDGDEVAVMEHISHITHHTTMEGSEGFLFYLRVVPVREVPGTIFMRTLRYGEHDDGRRGHRRPEDAVVFENGEPRVHIDHVDEFEGKGVTGYVPLAPVLFTWMSLAAQHHSEDKQRYLLAAARRLDRAQTLFERVDEMRREILDSPPETGAPAVRRAAFELIGMAELATVSLGRAVDMCIQAGDHIGTTVPVKDDITNLRRAAKDSQRL